MPYDELGQVVSGRKYWADGTEVAGQQFDYTFDTIGNRKNTGGRASAVSTYSVNRLNQYSQRTVPNQVDVLGIANPTADVTVRVLGGTTFTAGRKGSIIITPWRWGTTSIRRSKPSHFTEPRRSKPTGSSTRPRPRRSCTTPTAT
jgi:hypothetical protein